MFCCTVLEGHIQTQIHMVLEMAGLLCFDCVTLVIMLPYVLWLHKTHVQKNASNSCLVVLSLWEIMLSLGRLC